jgi:hypothetical protein
VPSADKAKDALWKEYNELQPKIHQCMIAIEKAVRNNNIWQDENLTMEECKARAYHFVGAFFLAQVSRLYKQEAREVLV